MGCVFGIFGQHNRQLLQRMNDAVDHRGGRVFQAAGNEVSLGQRSPAFRAETGFPTCTDKPIAVALDGDIVNRVELAKSLAAAGGIHVDPANTADLLAALYLHYGDSFPQYLDGGFALALRDGTKLLLARDPMGVRPLFAHRSPRRLVFASQIKALKHAVGEPLQINWEVLFERYVFGDHLLGDSTYFVGTKQVKPGHVWIVEQRGDGFSVQDQALERPMTNLPPADSEEYQHQVVALLERNVKFYVENCGSVGVLLSGGFDSSVLAAMAAKHASGKVRTFTLSDDPQFPDVLAARRVAEHLDTEHHEFIISAPSFKQNLVAGVYAYEDLIYRDTIFMLASNTGGSVDTVLSGAGADLFGLPVLLRSDIARRGQLWQKLINLTRGKVKRYPIGRYMDRFLRGVAQDPRVTAYDHFITDYLPNQIFPSTERACAYHGLEACFPYADQTLHALAKAMPHSLRLVNDIEKPILREACAHLDLPEEILKRPTYCSKHNLKKSKATLRGELSVTELDHQMNPAMRQLFPDTYTANCFYFLRRLFTEVDTMPEDVLIQLEEPEVA